MFGVNMFPDAMRPFNTQYRCYSVSMLPGNERQDIEKGGKIIMPPSALDHLTRLNVVYPMLFRLTNQRTNRQTHCGVLEFVADEGKVYLPYWMMRNLLLEEGGLVQIENTCLPVATFSTFQPQSQDFLDITNPKAVLENALRLFACLTTGDVIAIEYNDRIYELRVLETRPGPAVTIIECDMSVEFAAPVGYVEPEKVSRKDENTEPEGEDVQFQPEERGFLPFTGEGNRLDGKQRNPQTSTSPVAKVPHQRGIPDYDFQLGTLRFIRNPKRTAPEVKETTEDFQAFSGQGVSLREASKTNKKR